MGTEKTGTTSLQHALAENRAALASQGVFFPLSFGKVNHTRLVAASQPDGVVDNIKAHLLAARRETEHELRDSLRSDFRKEADAQPDWNTLLVSSELIHSRLHSATDIERLCGFFSDLVDEVVFCVVLRRQDELAVSRFSSALRAGYSGEDDVFGDLSDHVYLSLPDGHRVDDHEHYYDYLHLVRRFADAGGGGNVQVFKYGCEAGSGDFITAMSRQLGVGSEMLSAGGERKNEAMSFRAQRVIATLNGQVPSLLPGGKRNEKYRKIKVRIEGELLGPRRQFSRDDAKRFAERFRDTNEAVQREFLSGSGSLFSDDFSQYPDQAINDCAEAELRELTEFYLEEYTKLTDGKPKLLKKLAGRFFGGRS